MSATRARQQPTLVLPTLVPIPTPQAAAVDVPSAAAPAGMLAPTLSDAAGLGLMPSDEAATLATILPSDVIPVGCADAGCVLAPNAVGLQNLSRPDEIQGWRLTVADGQTLTILLTGLTVDYDLHVRGPDGTLAGQDETDSPVDHAVELSSLPGGTYVIYVNSGRGELSDQPYALAVLPRHPWLLIYRVRCLKELLVRRPAAPTGSRPDKRTRAGAVR